MSQLLSLQKLLSVRNAYLSFGLITTVVLVCVGCRKKPGEDQTPTTKPPHNAEFLLADADVKDRWILKASRKLRRGIEPSAEQLTAWHNKSPNDILSEILNTPEAKDGGLDFILYFMGFKDDHWIMPTGKPYDLSLGFDTSKSRSLSSFSVAVEASLALNKGEDFLGTLAKLNGRYFAQPLPHGKIKLGDKEYDLSADTKRLFEKIRIERQLMNDMATAGKVNPEICKLMPNQGSDAMIAGFLDSFLSSVIVFPQFNLSFVFDCDKRAGKLKDGEKPPTDELPKNFEKYQEAINQLADIANTYESQFNADQYTPKTLADLKPFEFKKTLLSPSSNELARGWFWGHERNSSTNRNRKRAAYVLKRFLCDDLTPIGVEVPAQHASDQHASDPGCVSCHYKLDPMAGFFRKLGRLGAENDLIADQFLQFDDNAVTKAKEYFESWKGPDGKYEIGYVRSQTDKSLNTYPQHSDDPEFSDLVEILKTAPEVKRCLVKRTFQYLVGEEVALDRGYQSELESVYESDPNRSSALSFKEILKTVALSYSFVRDTSDRGVCYDYPINYDPVGKPACEIGFIVEQNCSGSCHSKANAAGGLDMSSWTTPTTANEVGGFMHKNQETGSRFSYAESIGRVAERLNTTDSGKRMPLSKSMNPVDRETLYLWTQSQLKGVK